MAESPSILYKKDFMCVCNTDARFEAEACYKRILRQVEATPESFLSSVAIKLMLIAGDTGPEDPYPHFMAEISGIHWDQWGLVGIDVQRCEGPGKGYVEYARIGVECDRAEHGLARAYELALEVISEGGR